MSQTYLQIAFVTLTNSRRAIEVRTSLLLGTGSDTSVQKDNVGKLKLTRKRRTIHFLNAVPYTRNISSEVAISILIPQINKGDCFNMDRPMCSFM